MQATYETDNQHSRHPWQTDDVNEWVMEEAAPPTQPELEPEVPEVPVWVEPPVTIEQKDSVEGEESISESLVNAGNEEAVLEQRVSADNAETANPEPPPTPGLRREGSRGDEKSDFLAD